VAQRCGFGLFAALLATLVAAFFPHGVIANPGAAAGALAGAGGRRRA
jgi:quinate dehydrogenase (quinone)